MRFDGGSRGNPGPAGIGVTITTPPPTPQRIYELGEYLGRCTNNVAEYTALVRGLEAALALGAHKVIVKADSELVVRQLAGQYRVKSPDLKPLYAKAIALMRQIGDVHVNHVYREHNGRADALANAAMDSLGKVEPLGPLPLPTRSIGEHRV
jgi:ribonuclease HI